MLPWSQSQGALRERGRSEARAVGAVLIGGAGLVELSLLLPHPSEVNEPALLAIATAMFAAGLACFVLSHRIPIALTHVALATSAAAAGLLTYQSGVAAGQYGSLYVWAMLIAGYYFTRRVALAHLGWLLAVNAVTLALVDSTSGYSPLTRWLFTAISLSVVVLLTSALVARRQRADLRARRFFDLSQDMLCTSNTDGYFVELNSAWQRNLGFTPEELRSRPFIERVHPDDRERTETEAADLFSGAGRVGFENRYLAKDGSVHWLHWSATLAADESLIYARAADVTEFKRVAEEREALLAEVEALAVTDTLTGLPNRRALDERLPTEFSRARRRGSSLCLAVIDLDRFKAYNDTHGHLRGDALLRECAVAWDQQLRGEDTIVRFGGEEFLVLLPDVSMGEAGEIVERLRTATPGEQTCSAGLACWDLRESAADLIGRADEALYRAKEEGRDRLVAAES
ncbi:MAG TPA: sensor domain-containing diguanylate cyclase [Solirubrobacterales bacterium]|nr:sensor domain-containing diguanylate cyclase [Solirubrobacterales bacterium]